jgi:hypothetical protein
MSRKEETQTATGVRIVRKNQAVLVLTETPGKTINGIIRSVGKVKSLIRYAEEDGTIRERQIENNKFLVVKCRPASTPA